MSDAFALFALVPRFALDRAALDAAFRAVQAEVHPDKFAHADAATQRQAGIEPFDPANTRISPAFLLQQIEWREQLEAATQVAALEALEKRIAEAARDHEHRLAVLIDQEGDLVMATETLRELRFIEKLGEEIQSAFETLDP